MRDDVLSLLSDIRSAKNEILPLIKDLLRREDENRLHLKSGNLSALEENLGESANDMERIDTVRSEISGLFLELKRISGLSDAGLHDLMTKGDDPVLGEIRRIDDETGRSAESLKKQRDILIGAMEGMSLSLKKEMDELRDLERILPRIKF